MKYTYSEFDGEGFMGPDDLFPKPKMMEFIMQYGEEALEAMSELEDPDQQEMIQQMIDAGLMERDEDGNLRLTNKMLRGIQHRSLLQVFEGMNLGTRGSHETRHPGQAGERADGTRAYQFGDTASDLDLAATMRNAARRQRGSSEKIKLPLKFDHNDFEVHQTEGQTDCAMVMLIDMSGSMMRYGRFYRAKQIALGMAELMRSKFPHDTIDYVGFYSWAERIEARDLPLVMPKPVTIREPRVRLRVPLEQARQNADRMPQHFTNLHDGLRLARQILARRGAANKQIFIITDGQPTAHIQPNSGDAGGASGGGDMLYLLYPPTEETSEITLTEALKCQQQGMRLSTFALVEDYWGMDWVGFVDQLTRLTRGLAYYCSSDDLGSTVVESYLQGKKSRTFGG